MHKNKDHKREITWEIYNTTKANTTRDSVYTIKKYTLTNTSNTFRIKQQQAWGSDKYENARTQAVAINFSKRREYEPSTLRTLYRLRLSARPVSINSVSLMWSCGLISLAI